MKILYYKGQHPNFGDDLNEIVWPAYAPELFDHMNGDVVEGFLGIGTLIGRSFPRVDRFHVFSSGAGLDCITRQHADYQYWCVRGPLTARALGLPSDRSIIDGGVLAPNLLGINRSASSNHRPAVIPHWQSMLLGGWSEACELADCDLVNPMNAPYDVIKAIAGAPLVITESLHGAIVADVMRIPWIAIGTTANFSLFKWVDWASSVSTVLRVVPVRPPTYEALVKFGRPSIGRMGRPEIIEVDQAFHHFSRWGLEDNKPLRYRYAARKIVNWMLLRSGEKIAGVSPEGTAQVLRSIIRNVDPQLSPSGRNDELIAALLTRLNDLRYAYAAAKI